MPEQSKGSSESSNGLTRAIFLKRSAGVAASLSFGSILAACGSSNGKLAASAAGAKPPAKPTGVLRFPLESATTTFDPAFGNLLPDQIVARSMFDQLVTFNPDNGELAPSLATSWEESDDAKEFVFHLRQNVTFHDGEPFDSTALKQTFTYLASAAGSLASLLMPKLVKLDDSDPTVLKVVCADPAPDFVRAQTFYGAMSPKAIAKGAAYLKAHPIGTGAYKFAGLAGGNGVNVEAFENYWGSGPYFERVAFSVITDAGARVSAVLSGQTDISYRTPPTQLPRVQGSGKVKTVTGPVWSGNYVPLCTNVKPFDDLRVRQAVAYAIDKQALIQAVIRGQGEVADSYSPKGLPGYAVPSTIYQHDPDHARKLLEEAGAKGAKMVMCVSTSQYAEPQLSQAIAGQLNEVGFDATVEVVDPVAQNRALLDPKQQKYSSFPTDYTWLTGTPLIQLVGGIDVGSRYTKPDLETLLTKAKITANGPARQAIFQQIENLNAEQVLVIPLFHSIYSDVIAANLDGYPSHTPLNGYGPDIYPMYRG